MGAYGEYQEELVEREKNVIKKERDELVEKLGLCESELSSLRDNIRDEFYGIFNDRCSNCLTWTINNRIIAAKDYLANLDDEALKVLAKKRLDKPQNV